MIVVDAYHQPYIPFYLATKEFFALVRERLNPGGVVALNVAGVPGDERLSRAIGTRLLAAFPDALATAALQRADARLRPPGVARGALAPRDGRARAGRLARAALPGRARGGRAVRPAAHRRSRARRWLTDRMIVDFVSRGGDLDEESSRPTPTSSGRSVLRLERRADGGPLRIGHRGAAALAPANSLAAIEAGSPSG